MLHLFISCSSLKRKEAKQLFYILSRSAGADVREQIACPSVRPRVHLSEGKNSDECASYLEVNGGIELWLWSRVSGEVRG